MEANLLTRRLEHLIAELKKLLPDESPIHGSLKEDSSGAFRALFKLRLFKSDLVSHAREFDGQDALNKAAWRLKRRILREKKKMKFRKRRLKRFFQSSSDEASLAA